MPRRKNDEVLKAENLNEIELIKISVDKVKKEVSEVSTFTKKEVDAIIKKIDSIIYKVEEANKINLKGIQDAAKYTENYYLHMTEEEKKAALRTARTLENIANKKVQEELKAARKISEAREKVLKDQESQFEAFITEHKNNQQKQQDYIRSAMKGDFSSIILKNNSAKKDRIMNMASSVEQKLVDGKISQQMADHQLSNLAGVYKKLDASAGKIQAGAVVIKTTFDGVGKLVKIWSDRFFNGMDKIINTYESTYQKQAVMTGVNQEQYFKAQKQMQNSLNEQNLQNNIAITDVMQATADFTQSGITNMTEAMKMGEQKAIGSVLAPYLDQTSDAFISLSQTLGPKFSKQMIGIGNFVSSNIGSNRMIVKNLDSMISQLEPVSLASKKSLMGEEELAKIEALTKPYSEGGAGMTMQQATQFVSDAIDVMNNPIKSLNNGNLLQQIVAAEELGNEEPFTLGETLSKSAEAYKDTASGLSGSGFAAYLEATGITASNWANNNSERISDIIDMSKEEFQQTFGLSGADNAEESYKKQMSKLANDELNTNKQMHDIMAESLSVDMAILQEKWPDLMNVLRQIVPGILGGLAMWAGGKLLFKGAEKILGKGATTIGGAVATGLAGGAVATGLAGVAGIAAGAYGINKGIGQLQGGETGLGVTNIVGGSTAAAGGIMLAGGTAASMMGAGVANAWNPVGWVLLASGGLAMISAAVAKTIDHASDSEKIFEKLQNQTKIDIKAKREQHEQEIQYLYQYQSIIDDTTDSEVAKKLIIEAGIATEEELQDEKYESIKALKKLTKQYIISANQLSEDSINFFNDISTYKDEQQAGFTTDFLNKFVGKDYNIQSEKDTMAVLKYGQAMQQYAKDLISEGKISQDGKEYDKQYKHIAYMVKNGLLTQNYVDKDLSYEDYSILFTKGMDKDRRTTGENMMSIDKYANMLMGDSYARDILGNKYKYQHLGDEDTANDYFNSLMAASKARDKSGVERAVINLKTLGYSKADQFGNSKDTVLNALKVVGINSYAIGTNYVKANDQLAYLHEGEAVLTKSAATLLRQGTELPISTAAGVNDALANSGMNQQAVGTLVSAINNQTTQLVLKLDQIISAINSRLSRGKYNNNFVTFSKDPLQSLSESVTD